MVFTDWDLWAAAGTWNNVFAIEPHKLVEASEGLVVELKKGIADGLSVRIAALDDIIDSKRAANRPKDRMALPYLESLRDELRGR